MTFLRGSKANVKPLFAARAYKTLAELKSAITNYCEENRETTHDLPMEWGTKENSPIHPASDTKVSRSKVKRVCNLPNCRWSLSHTNTHISREFTNTLPALWVGIGHVKSPRFILFFTDRLFAHQIARIERYVMCSNIECDVRWLRLVFVSYLCSRIFIAVGQVNFICKRSSRLELSDDEGDTLCYLISPSVDDMGVSSNRHLHTEPKLHRDVAFSSNSDLFS
ncbi:hypothetical protein EVAR_14247_1 [Eumeta japonica]|uniref:Uncharacterized protein n=1 Tax=Eumeta variegata TaxID=151549 RepID=A0A4C1W8L1_EUMVA|nr:hypothetical protein EVAR_14247_1 [Eumeta japonica]